MEMEHTLIGGLRARFARQNAGAPITSPDWRGLQARFVAAHAARRGQLAARTLAQAPLGSFDPGIAATFGDGGFVNHANSTDGKDPSPITVAYAGNGKSGGKGYV